MPVSRFSSIALIGLVLTATGSSLAHAGGCFEYANQAVISAAQNRAWGCGYYGLRWTENFNAHLAYCRRVGYPAAYPERIERQRALHACRY